MIRFLKFFFLSLVAITLTISQAQAVSPGDWATDPSVLLDETSASYVQAHGVGSPSVSYDVDNGQFVMVSEFWSDVVDARCPHGVWGLAVSRSSDGVNWVMQPTPAYLPTPGNGTPYSCVTAHPSTMWELRSNGRIDYTKLRVWFKAEQGRDACDTTTPNWGCELYTGVGDMVIEFKGNGDIKKTTVSSNLNINISSEFGFPNVVQRVDTQYVMLVQIEGSLYASSSSMPHGQWGPLELVQTPGNYAWNQDFVMNPEMMCMDDQTLQSFTGGWTTGGTYNITSAAWAPATSSYGFSWKWPNNPQFTWDNNNEWRHWTALRVGPDDYLVWYAEKNPTNGKLQIRYTSTTAAWIPADIVDRRCE